MKTRSIVLMMAALSLAAIAQITLLGGGTKAIVDSSDQAGTTTAASQIQRFTNVEGADFRSKLDAAMKLGRSRSQQSPFWVAYSFDVRPGIAVDPNVSSFSGSMTNFGSVTLFFGTSGGVTIETRNLGVFALVQPADNSISRIEVYNLERQREYSGYQVYWLGRAGNQESLDYLKNLAESGASRKVAEGATMAVGMHDAMQVGVALKDLTRRSSINDVRTAAIFWLGFVGGEQAFLADIVRNEQENAEVREAAAAAIGRSREAAVLPVLQNLYGQVTNRDVKEQIINSISKNDDQKSAIDFLVKVARTDADRELKEAAVHRLGRLPGTQSFLADVARNEQEHQDIREAAVHAIGRSEDGEAISTLQSMYKSVANQDVREAILNAVAKNQDQRAATSFLVQVAKSDPSHDLREQAVHRLGKMPGNESLLLEIARNEKEDEGVREAAVNAIGKSSDATALSTLQSLYESVNDRELKERILNSIARNQDQEAALNFIIKVAESDSDRDLKEQAVSRLARFSSGRSFEALKKVAMNPASDSDLQEQAVHAISRRANDEAIPALIEIAKSHPRVEVREVAIRRLGKMNDERAKEFLKQLLSN